MKTKNNFLVLGLIIVSVIFISGCVEQQTQSNKIIFTLPDGISEEATEGVPYSLTFCEPDSARSGATCGALAGTTINPYGGSPPYSFSVQLGKGFLPPGLTLELNGLLKGTPTLVGTYTFGICAKDAYDEECQTTSIIVNPKAEQITPSIKIESATATLKKVEKYVGGVEDHICTVKMSGTITGPLCTFLTLSRGRTNGEPGRLIYPYECPSWRYWGTSILCSRDPGAPETTKWSITTEQTFYDFEGHKDEFIAIMDTSKQPVVNPSGGNLCTAAVLDQKITDSVFLTC